MMTKSREAAFMILAGSLQWSVIAKQLRMTDKFLRHRALVRQILENVFNAFVRYVGHGLEQTDEGFHGLS